ncbi:MAG: helix-turn-helix domain-containing protein [Cetobacterium sp.]|uniref:helix-turn-helix domain-containing protein n=1 Tax=Cetobacterium sp. TaxID=2071632 RepID=UPI003F40F9EC
MNLRKAIEYFLNKKGMTQAELGILIGKGQPHISRIMKHNNCSHETMKKMADGFGVKLSTFVKAGE